MKHKQTNIGSLRKRETTQPQQHTEYYLFNSQGNLKAYSDDVMSFAYYGYNAANTRTYKLSLYNTNLWINGQQQPLNLQLQNAMFYPNTYLNFNQNGEYTKHYYNGMERVASRLGNNTTTIAISNNILEDRKLQVEDLFKEDIQELISETPQVDMPPMLDILNLQPTGTPNDIYYYHPNHLGSTAFVTDNNATVIQGFLYAPFGEITTEYNVNFGSSVIPKYAFNAKELDEETGMYYYEARYYAPPVFTSRDPLFEKYFWMSPYAYCANNPVKYVDPSGKEYDGYEGSNGQYKWFENHSEKSFTENNVKWTKVTENKSNWEEATAIRDANIEGLVNLGFERSQVENDVRLYEGDNPLFTKESKLNNANNYIGFWKSSYNSGGETAYESPEIKNTGYSLKYYPTKNGEQKALGIVKRGKLGHYFEGGMEWVERKIFNQKADKDPLYDMHYRNACGLSTALRNSKIDISAPPTIYSVYHRSGGMKLP